MSLVEPIVQEYVKRVVEKARAGKKLSDWEIGMLMMDYVRASLSNRIDAVEKGLSDRIDSVEADVNDLKERFNAFDKKLTLIEGGLDPKGLRAMPSPR